MLSYWENAYLFKKPDYLIVGGGIVGMATAFYLKKQNPDKEIVIIERGFLPDGASSKNAGFCCFGSVTELIDDIEKFGENNVSALAEKRFEGLKLLRSILGDKAIRYEHDGGYEIFDNKNDFEFYLNKIELLNKLLHKIGSKIYSDASNSVSTFGLNKVVGIIKNNFEGQINTAKMIEAFLKLLQKINVRIHYGIELKLFENSSSGVRIVVGNDIEFKCEKLFIATNGFAKQLLPELDVEPARAQVLVTSPIENLRLKGSFHYNKGYYYFRNIDNRVLLGGGRNLDFKTENTFSEGLTTLVQNRLDSILRNVILPDKKFNVEMRWSGIMGVGGEKKTIVKSITNNVYCGVRMGGMGVALGTLIGKELADLSEKE